jgi:hypothetical protein
LVAARSRVRSHSKSTLAAFMLCPGILGVALPVRGEIDCKVTVVLLEIITTEEAKKLYGYPFQGVRWRVALFSVQNGSTYIAAEDIGMVELGLNADAWRVQRIFWAKIDTQVKRLTAVWPEY